MGNICCASHERSSQTENKIHDPDNIIEYTIYIDPPQKHTHTLIWIPYLTGNAENCRKNFVNTEEAPLFFPNMRVVIPSAKKQPVTAMDGMVTHSWFDWRKSVPFDEDIEAVRNGQKAELLKEIQNERYS